MSKYPIYVYVLVGGKKKKQLVGYQLDLFNIETDEVYDDLRNYK